MTQQVPASVAIDVDPAVRLLAIRHAFLDRLWASVLLIAIVGVPVSVMRAQSTGWLHVYSFHIFIGVLAVVLSVARQHVPYRAKLNILLALFAAIGCSGIFTLGLMGSGVWFLVMCSLLSSTFFSTRTGVLVAVGTGAILSVAALLFTNGILKMPYDANVYATSLAGWVVLLLSASIMPYFVFTAFGAYQRTIVDLLQELKQQRDHIADIAARDQLTGLPMANLANDRMEMKIQSAMRDGSRVAFLFVDLNGFKAVNDTWGHEAGDHLLQVIAARLKQCVRAEDTVARVGGDEFIVMLGSLKGRREAIPVAEKLIASVCEPVIHAGHSIICGASVGISIFPEDATDIATLRRLADRAMYQIKRTGKSGFAFADIAVPLTEIPAEY